MGIERVNKYSYIVDPEVEAISKLRAWQHLVWALPHLVSVDTRRVTMRELGAWYERVLENEDEANDPPIAGLDALTDELTLVSVPHDVLVEMARARWAVRVAEELVQWRQCLRNEGSGSVPLADATNRLGDAIDAGCLHIEGHG